MVSVDYYFTMLYMLAVQTLDIEHSLTVPLYSFDPWENILPNFFKNTLKSLETIQIDSTWSIY